MPALTVCIGFDPKETVAWHVLAHSILRRASRPVRILPVNLKQLAGWCYRRPDPRSEGASTEFAFTRFLTPYLAGGGTSVFLDADMLVLGDICELEEVAHTASSSDVLVVKHDYTPKTKRKFLDQPQSTYPCKNWSSVMVFNGYRTACRKLTPAYINAAPPMHLHQFEWATNVGELDPAWNHLVGEYKPNPKAKLVHFTNGGPWFKAYQHCEYAKEWFDEFTDMCHCEEPSAFRYKAASEILQEGSSS